MKTKFKIITALGVVAVACLLWLVVQMMSRNCYRNHLPRNIKAVAVVDVQQLATGSSVKFDRLVKDFGLELEKLSSIDCKEPVYAFVTSDGRMGALLAVSDEDGLVKAVHSISSSASITALEERAGIHFFNVNDSWLLAIDSHSAMLYGPVLKAEMSMARQRVVDYFKQDEEESGMNSPLLADARKHNKPLSIACTLDAFPQVFNESFLLGLPPHSNLSDINLSAGFEVIPAGLRADVAINSIRDDVNAYFDNLTNIGSRLTGDYAVYVPRHALFWWCVGVKGEQALEKMRENNDLRTMLLALNMGVDVDAMIKSLQGDVSITAYNIPSFQSQQPFDFVFTGRLAKSDFLAESDYWLNHPVGGVRLQRLSAQPDAFHIQTQDVEAKFGVISQPQPTLFVTSPHHDTVHLCTTSTHTMDEWKHMITSGHLFFWVNVQQLLQQPKVRQLMPMLEQNAFGEFIKDVQSVALSWKDTRHIQFEVHSAHGE